MELKIGWLMEQDQGFALNHSVTNHAPTTWRNGLFKIYPSVPPSIPNNHPEKHPPLSKARHTYIYHKHTYIHISYIHIHISLSYLGKEDHRQSTTNDREDGEHVVVFVVDEEVE